jgi:hypothetical protein
MSSFYTEVIKSDPRFGSNKRVADIDLLEPVTRQRVLEIVADAKAHGVDLMIYETYRSQQRQQELFAHGATKLRMVGVHHYGLACDLVKDIHGDPSWKGDFSIVGELAHHHGLIWGGDWGRPGIKHSFVDPVHVQRCKVAHQAALFRGDWYPDQDYDPYR